MNRIFPNVRRLIILIVCFFFCLFALWRIRGGGSGSSGGGRPSDAHGATEAVGRGKTRAPQQAPSQMPPAPGVVVPAPPDQTSRVTDRGTGAQASSSNPARRFPLLDDPAQSEFDRGQALVRIVHQSWVTATLPPLFARWAKSFLKCFPTYRYALWSDDDNRRLIARHYPWFLPRFDSYGVGVQKADVSRLFYMYHYGGVYCDLDCECLENFEHLLVNVSLAFGAMDGKMIFSQSDPQFVDEGQIENSFMYSRPKHPFFWNLILQLNATTVGMPIMTSGPYLIMKGIHSARQNGLDKTQVDGRPYLTIYPPQLFNPYSWIKHNAPQCRLYGDFTEESLTKCRDSFKGSYVLQYHTQVWDKGKTNILERIKL